MDYPEEDPPIDTPHCYPVLLEVERLHETLICQNLDGCFIKLTAIPSVVAGDRSEGSTGCTDGEVDSVVGLVEIGAYGVQLCSEGATGEHRVCWRNEQNLLAIKVVCEQRRRDNVSTSDEQPVVVSIQEVGIGTGDGGWLVEP